MSYIDEAGKISYENNQAAKNPLQIKVDVCSKAAKETRRESLREYIV